MPWNCTFLCGVLNASKSLICLFLFQLKKPLSFHFTDAFCPLLSSCVINTVCNTSVHLSIYEKKTKEEYSPIWHGSFFSNGITPHVKSYAHYSASNKCDKHHKGADQQIQEGIKERAAIKGKKNVTHKQLKHDISSLSEQHTLGTKIISFHLKHICFN